MGIKPFSRPLYVTRPLLPEMKEVTRMLKTIWQSGQVTNNGSMVRQLEMELECFLKVDCLSVFSSGTAALQVAFRTLRLTGEVITTPFTFAATAHALAWMGIKPVFCDIEEDTLNIDPDKIEGLITAETSAILPVHVFGNPCDTGRIQHMAKKHGLKVVYDGAHAFGTEVEGKPIGSFGDITMFSFHATKVFNTIEGGALAFGSPYLKDRADSLKNFGLVDGELSAEPGINGKLNELQAAIGILNLRLVKDETAARKELTGLYRELLKDIPGIDAGHDIKGVVHSYPYFVIRVDRDEFGMSRDELFERLKQCNIFARRYFYPLISRLPCYKNLPSASPGSLPVAEQAAERVLALPLHGRLLREDVERVCGIIRYIRG